MIQTQYQVYDFASSARVERPLWLAHNQWMTKFAELFVEHWSNFSATTIGAVPSPIDASEFESLQTDWNDPTYYAEVYFQQDTSKGMLLINRLELLTMLMDILGSSVEDQTDRELTSVESSLSNLIFEQAAATLGQAWLEQETLEFKLGPLTDQPNRSRMFPAEKKLLMGGLSIQLPNATARVQLVLAKEETCKMLGVKPREAVELNPNNRVSHQKISEVNVEVSAGLGSAEIPMTDLVAIAEGDIITFDQRIEDPITVFANQEPVFLAWPGRCEHAQALKIVSPV